MKVLILGYKNYELGIFNHNQPEVKVLKDFLEVKIIEYLDNGAKWFILQNYPGIDMYAGEILMKLKKTYEFSYIILKPFYDYDSRFKEEEKLLLKEIEEHSDFSSYIFKRPYEYKEMYISINHFLIEHSTHTLIIYDEETDTKLKYIYNALLENTDNSSYNIERIQFDELNDFISSHYDN